jgi:hypothetical protein
MANFILLDSMRDATFSSRWTESSKFLAYGRFLDKKGNFVKFRAPCTKYQAAIKKERLYTIPERVDRAVQGIFLTLLSLGLCLISSDCRKLFTAEKKVLRFAILLKTEKPELNVNMEDTLKSKCFL